MRWEQSIQYGVLSDIGFRRRNNQDSSAVQICSDQAAWKQHGHLFLVADGMGGHAVGELASKIAADTLPHTFYKIRDKSVAEALKTAIEVANATIFERSAHNRDFARMGTTCSTLVLGPEGAVIGHVGDSRVYRLRGERLDQLSFDHSLQWELLRQGKMKPEDIFLHEPRHVITRSLGPEPHVQVDVEGPYPVAPGDTYLLCSDGLTGHLNDAEIGMILSALPPGEACRLLVNLANLRGGSDNVTVIVVRVGDLPEGVEATDISGPDSADDGLSWGWLGAFWAMGIAFAVGVCLLLLGHKTQGWWLAGLGLASFLGAIGWRLRRKWPLRGKRQASETVVWRPYRTASAKLNRKFLIHLAAIEAELQRTATEEGWTIDWPKHEAAFKSATAATNRNDQKGAFRAYSQAIDVLMAGLHQHRRQLQQEARQMKARTAAAPEAGSEKTGEAPPALSAPDPPASAVDASAGHSQSPADA